MYDSSMAMNSRSSTKRNYIDIIYNNTNSNHTRTILATDNPSTELENTIPNIYLTTNDPTSSTATLGDMELCVSSMGLFGHVK